MVTKYTEKYLALQLIKISVFSAPFCSLAAHAEHADKFDFLMAEANHQINYSHDSKTNQRFTDWENLLHHSLGEVEVEKIRRVNNFFNRMNWVSDKQLWNKKDYWATPIESLIKNAGDCEDFSIAKYFTLLAMDIPQERLRIYYVKLPDQQHHMVMAYYPSSESEPIILDNINKQLLTRKQRSDLTFLFSFNSEFLWISGHKAIELNDDNALKHWANMMNRIEKEQG